VLPVEHSPLSVILVPNSDSVQELLTGLQWPNVTKIYIRYKKGNIKALATLFDQIAEFVRVKYLTAPYYFMQLITHPLPYLVSLQLADGIYPSDWLYRLGSTLTSLIFVEVDFGLICNSSLGYNNSICGRWSLLQHRSIAFGFLHLQGCSTKNPT
jgi:hypothetical protein